MRHDGLFLVFPVTFSIVGATESSET
jgi:hypothetical protein